MLAHCKAEFSALTEADAQINLEPPEGVET